MIALVIPLHADPTERRVRLEVSVGLDLIHQARELAALEGDPVALLRAHGLAVKAQVVLCPIVSPFEGDPYALRLFNTLRLAPSSAAWGLQQQIAGRLERMRRGKVRRSDLFKRHKILSASRPANDADADPILDAAARRKEQASRALRRERCRREGAR
jgi:hypothetical protein